MTIPRRIVETMIGPPGASGFLFRDLYQEFKVKGYRGSKPNECEVSIFNLSDEMIAYLEKPGHVIQLSAGAGVAGVLFRGKVQPKGIITDYGTSERTTRIVAVDGRMLWRDAKAVQSWPPNTSVAVVVQDLLRVATAQGFSLAPGNAMPLGIFPSGYYCAGRWRDALTEILAPRGYVWSIQDRVMYIALEGSAWPGNVPLVSPESGLTGNPTATSGGCDFTCLLDPRLRPGGAVQIKSKHIHGLFRVSLREHEGSSDGVKWETRAQCDRVST